MKDSARRQQPRFSQARDRAVTRSGGPIALGVAAVFGLLLLLAGEGGAASGTAERPEPYWVFFRDKGLGSPAAERAAVEDASRALAPRALARRMRARPGAPADARDVAVPAAYVAQVLAGGATHRTTSRWMNAVSVLATPSQLDAIRALPSVAEVRPVARGRRVPEPEPAAPDDRPAASPKTTGAGLDYGDCASQILPIQADRLHDAGYTGAGVLVCLMDTGFERTHQALTGVTVVAERDFINDDLVTSNEGSDDPTQHNHGTSVLSLIAGFTPGKLIGTAFDADFALAKTEDVTSETPAEEDFWTEAAEWADSLGADVISTSLAYIDWYVYDDLDGNTAVITQAADLAAANGILVFASAGNYGSTGWFYIAPPADGDSVFAVGAVDSFETIASFSSHGPTFDGRTKPDACAVGRGNLVAVAGTASNYSRGSGTSYSCPMTAGVGALLLEARPGWLPQEVASALRSTASRAAAPDNDYGWGVIRGWDALQTLTAVGPGGAGAPGSPAAPSFSLAPNPTSGPLRFRLDVASRPGEARLLVHDAGGRLVRVLWEGSAAAAPSALSWDGRDAGGRAAAAGVYFARLDAGGQRATRRFVLVR